MANMAEAEPVKRTSEIEEVTNVYVVHPISSRLTPLLARFGVRPNAVSVAGMACGVTAGLAYHDYARSLLYPVLGFLLMVVWHVLDGADGQLARLTNAQSQSGKVLDGICDYVTFTAVYAGLALVLSRQHGGWVWLLVAAAGLCHAVQAAAYELQRQDYEFWGWNKASAELPDLSSIPLGSGTVLGRAAARLHRLYARAQLFGAGMDAASRRRLAEALRARPDDANIRSSYRAMFAPSVRRWSALSANIRTLAIFVFTVLRAPLLYFVFEVTVLNIVLMVLLGRQRALASRFLSLLPAGQALANPRRANRRRAADRLPTR